MGLDLPSFRFRSSLLKTQKCWEISSLIFLTEWLLFQVSLLQPQKLKSKLLQLHSDARIAVFRKLNKLIQDLEVFQLTEDVIENQQRNVL